MTISSRRTSLLLAVILVISICFNLFLGGAWLTARWFEHRMSANFGTVLKAYPPSIRRDVIHRLFADRSDIRKSVQDLRQSRQHMIALMRADPLDKSALAEAMMDVRHRTDVLLALLQSALSDSVTGAPASERQKITVPKLSFKTLGEEGAE